VIANPIVTTIYSVTGTDSAGCASTAMDTVIVDSCGFVWPGDANDDLIVNNYDLISIGLYYGDSGYARDTTSYLWGPNPAKDWDSLQTDGYNRKFVDCNGDGVINSDDTLAITLNYGDIHQYHSPRRSSEERSGAAPLHFINDSSSYHPGSKVDVAVWLGNSTIRATGIYGLGYDIAIDTSIFQHGTLAFNYDNSFLGTKNSNVLSLTHISDDVETAVVGTDHVNKNGYGKIGDLYFTLNSSTDSSRLLISVSSSLALDSAGNVIVVNPINDTLTITNTTTSVNQLSANNNQLSIYPNPSSGQINIVSTKNIDALKVTNLLGQIIYTSQPRQSHFTFNINATGMYFVTITTEGEVSTSKLIVNK